MNMMKPGIWELVIVLVIVLLLFGPGRLSKIAGELGSGIRNFRDGISEGKEGENEEDEKTESEE
jgi:sec-independent protein translocase protein TatA